MRKKGDNSVANKKVTYSSSGQKRNKTGTQAAGSALGEVPARSSAAPIMHPASTREAVPESVHSQLAGNGVVSSS
jgi:hypothetical protein